VLLPGTGLECDAPGRTPLTYLSHAAVRTAATRVLATSGTVELAGRVERCAADITPPLGRPFALGDVDVTLLPSGYIPGASHLLAARPDGGRTLFVSRMGRDDELEDDTCDTLVLAPGLHDPAAAVRVAAGDGKLLSWIRGVLARRQTPVLLLEIPAMLARLGPVLCRAGLDVAATRAVGACSRRLASRGLDISCTIRRSGPMDGELFLAALPCGSRAAVRLPRRARVAAAIDAAGSDPAADLGVEVVHRIAHAAGLDAYERLGERSGARVVHLGEGLEAMPSRAGSRGLDVRWIGPERQMLLG